MEILVTYLTRRAKGGVSRRSDELSAESVRFGRNTSLEVYLPDPRVRLDHATLHVRPGGLLVEAEGLADIRVNGRPARTHMGRTGDVLGIGPYDVTIVAPPEGKEVAIEVELMRPLGDDFEKLQARSTLSLAEYGLSRRFWSWVGVLVTLSVFLAAPIIYFATHHEQSAKQKVGVRIDSVWSSGPISSAHKFISDQCGLCHEKAFVAVQNEACGACHAPTAHHFDPKADKFANVAELAALTSKSCGSCHKEHAEDGKISISKQFFCIDCHQKLETILPASSVKNAGRFDKNHPDFRVNIIVDPVGRLFKPVALSDKVTLMERSGLKFPHDAHLKEQGIRGPNGNETLNCASCHQLTHGAAKFQPIKMETTCERCHQLVFDPRRPDRTLPHGQATNAQLLLREFYADSALRGGFTEILPDSVAGAERRRPGTQPEITAGVRVDPRQWADNQAQRVADQSFGKVMCGKCHEVSFGADKGPLNWAVVPATVTKDWLPRGRFDHSAHIDMLKCDACHAAAKSSYATDVLVPSITACKDCHGDESATNLVPSTCITCHSFHRPGQPLMGQRDRRADWGELAPAASGADMPGANK